MSRDSHIYQGEWKDSLGDSKGRQVISPSSYGNWILTNIAAAGTTTAAIDLGWEYPFIQLILPTLTSASIKVQVSEAIGGTYQDARGGTVKTVLGTGAYTDILSIGGFRYIKLVSSVAQTAQVTLKVRGMSSIGAAPSVTSSNQPIVITEHPFGKDDLRSTGIQYSDVATTTAELTWKDVESITIEPPSSGKITEIEFGITWADCSSLTTTNFRGRVQGRDKSGTWTDLIHSTTSPSATGVAYHETTATATTDTYTDHTYSGRFETETNFDSVPFDLRVQVYTSSSTDSSTASGKVKNSSYVKYTYVPD